MSYNVVVTKTDTDMPHPADTALLDRALAVVERANRPVVLTARENATAFHKLALSTLRPTIERRRWLAKVRRSNAGVGRFYREGDLTELMALVAQYRGLARRYRRLARAEALAQRVAA